MFQNYSIKKRGISTKKLYKCFCKWRNDRKERNVSEETVLFGYLTIKKKNTRHHSFGDIVQ